MTNPVYPLTPAIRRMQIFARKSVAALLGGEYHSVFKGTGLSFEEVREYQPGDDIRFIDWNVTARTGTPFIKVYTEERELTVLLAVDVSRSMNFGSRETSKITVAAQIAAMLACCADAHSDRVGLLLFSDGMEKYIRPDRGQKHTSRLLREILAPTATGIGTSIAQAADHLQSVLKRRTIVFFISDFADSSAEAALKRLGIKHDLTLIRITDPLEDEIPKVGEILLRDAETGQNLLVRTDHPGFASAFVAKRIQRREAFRSLARSIKADVMELSTQGDPEAELIRFFRLRQKRRKRK